MFVGVPMLRKSNARVPPVTLRRRGRVLVVPPLRVNCAGAAFTNSPVPLMIPERLEL